MKALSYFLSIILFSTNLGDLLTTLIALSLGAREVNSLYYSLEPTLFFLVKILVPTVLIIIALIMTKLLSNHKAIMRSVCISMSLISIIFLYTIINNLIVIGRLINV